MIDDEATVLRATSSLLRSCGFSVRTFASAEEFLASENEEAPACIISDVQMQGMSGLDLFSLLRARNNPVPFIFITAFAEAPVRARVGDEVCVLQKPYQAEALIACIEKALPSS
ncbi:response regulator transcription factor [Rhizobium puerariae]|uniref:Response regulator transcription factor n=1 Tax=Rhizobium puerariae TaxID=1585791 RepID=A0ABV6AG88_9HYPH